MSEDGGSSPGSLPRCHTCNSVTCEIIKFAGSSAPTDDIVSTHMLYLLAAPALALMPSAAHPSAVARMPSRLAVHPVCVAKSPEEKTLLAASRCAPAPIPADDSNERCLDSC